MQVQAVLLAGDRGASKALRGRSKGFVEVAGRPMVVHVLEALLHTPEVSEVCVVGNARHLERVIAEFGCLALSARVGRPVHVVPQRSSLYENVWHTFLRLLPPGEPDPEHGILVVPTDIPVVVPEEISDFVQKAVKADVDYALGLSPDAALAPFKPRAGEPGIEMASFNLAEGRFRQNNLHYVRPLKMGNRHYIQDVYENRFQKEFGSMLRLGWRILYNEWRHLWVLGLYLLLHVAGSLERRGYIRAADLVRARVSIHSVERGISGMLRTRLRFVYTGFGGAALDVDNEADLAATEKMLGRWKSLQARRAR